MKHFKILYVLTVIIATVSFSLVSCSSGSSSPSGVLEKLFDLMKSKDFQGVSKLYVNKDGTKLSDEEYKKLEGLAEMGYSENKKRRH